jgi:3-polyprenyl-4-hydroxybenzoate decarboxylase
MTNIRKLLQLDQIDDITLYHYGLYVCSVAGDIKGLDRRVVTYRYNNLPIKCRSDIVLNGNDIMKLFDTF